MKRNNIKLFGTAFMAALFLASCSDEFLEEKKNYDNVNAGIYDYYSGANARVNDVYSWALPSPNSSANWQYNCTGNADDQSKSTEEYSGFGAFVNPDAPMTVMGGTKVQDFFHNQSNNIQASVWGRIRNINDVIQGVTKGALSQNDKDKLLGQVYFFRAWCYYNLVKWYGGVPIVKDVLEPIESSVVPRSSAKACIEFICEDLDMAAAMLTAATANGGWGAEDWGRVTSGTALALKGRVLLLWASPMFNRTNDVERWKTAYDEIKNSISVLNACGYDLFQTSSNTNGSDFAQMFATTRSSEAVFVTLFNTVQTGDGQKNNNWERGIRPKNTTGSGLEASAMMVDMFPMSDGKKPASCATYSKLDASEYEYEGEFPFMNRDPRFYRTFAFPGVRWAYSGDPTQADPNNPSYNGGKDYTLWNYVWYTSLDDQGNAESGNSYGADNLLTSKKGVYVRKRSDDQDVKSPLYSFAPKDNNGGFAYSAAPYLEIRYAEVLLNYAEAACGAGQLSEAVEQLQKIRARVGYEASNNYGLSSELSSDQAACMSAILYERQIELAYEGKRFDDLRRWMLFDGGKGQADGAPATWTLTGWGGNTCTYLGFLPLNGQRRENMEFRVADSYGIGGTTADSDPLAAVTRPSGVDYRKADLSSQLTTLKSFYDSSFKRKLKKGDGRDQNKIDLYMMFYPRYYFLGLAQGAQNSNKDLPQTIGWEDYNKAGANGTFDPLAE